MKILLLLVLPILLLTIGISVNSFKKAEPGEPVPSNKYLWFVLMALALYMVYYHFDLPFYIFLVFFIPIFFV